MTPQISSQGVLNVFDWILQLKIGVLCDRRKPILVSKMHKKLTYPGAIWPLLLGYSSGCWPYLRYTSNCCSARESKLKYVWSVKLSTWKTNLTKLVSDMNVWGCSVSPQKRPGSFLLDSSVFVFPSTICKQTIKKQELVQELWNFLLYNNFWEIWVNQFNFLILPRSSSEDAIQIQIATNTPVYV